MNPLPKTQGIFFCIKFFFVPLVSLFCKTNMSFKRTAIGLIIVSAVTAVVIGVYLWFNFNSRSNLVLVVPRNCHWMYHFQTSKIRKITSGVPPVYLDSLMSTIQSLPIFEKITDPAQPGIKPYSDIVVFANKYGKYVALTLNSESNFQGFLENLPRGKFTGGIIHAGKYQFVKSVHHPIYFAYKHKALVIFAPKDTTDKLDVVKAGLAAVFEKSEDENPMSKRELKELYDQDCQIVFYNQSNDLPSHGVILNNVQAKFVSGKGRQIQAKTPLKLFDAVMGDTKKPVKKNKTISSTQYLNLTFKAIYYQLIPFSNDKK